MLRHVNSQEQVESGSNYESESNYGSEFDDQKSYMSGMSFLDDNVSDINHYSLRSVKKKFYQFDENIFDDE
jgi:hypothetical protein